MSHVKLDTALDNRLAPGMESFGGRDTVPRFPVINWTANVSFMAAPGSRNCQSTNLGWFPNMSALIFTPVPVLSHVAGKEDITTNGYSCCFAP